MRRWMLAVAAPALAVLLVMSGLTGTALAASGEEQADEAKEKRKAKDKEQRKKDKDFNREIEYRRVVGPNVLPLGPYTVSLFVQGQLTEGRVRVAVQPNSQEAKQRLEAEKWALNGIVYPLCVRMFESGRPSTEDIHNFKIDAKSQLDQRFKNMVKEVFIESLI